MSKADSTNAEKGRDFEGCAAQVLARHFGVRFHISYPANIGNPPKQHKFDLVSYDLKYVGECKNYSWTVSGNAPSAKIGQTNEAVFYLQHLPAEQQRFIVMRKDMHPTRLESLAEYYFRTCKHLLNDVFIVEIDVARGAVREFRV
jgi:hypothetical protein